MTNLTDMFKVHIDFDHSHLFFPSIVEGTLLVLLLAIAVVHGPELFAQWRSGAVGSRLVNWKIDKKRLLGCLALTTVYFTAMEPVGRLYPNSGTGFLLTSIVYGFLLSWLFARDINKRKWVLMALSSTLTPFLVWLVFSHVFRITLP